MPNLFPLFAAFVCGATLAGLLSGLYARHRLASERATAERERLAQERVRTSIAEREAQRYHALQRERDGLAEALARGDTRLRDPVEVARRTRIGALPDLTARVAVGPCTADARLLDLAFEHAAVEVDGSTAARLVPGLPVRLHLTLGECALSAGAVAIAPTRTDPEGVEWLVRLAERLTTTDLPPPLLAAILARRDRRVVPSGDKPVTATLITPGGEVAASVADVSQSGVGLVVTLTPVALGDLHHDLHVRIVLPMQGRTVVLAARLRNIAPRPVGQRLGLAFADDDLVDRTRLATWLQGSEDATLDYS